MSQRVPVDPASAPPFGGAARSGKPDLAHFEDKIYAVARELIGDAALATGPLVRSIVDRSKRYTSDRAKLAQPADPIGDLAARAVFFTIADAMKLAIPLGELARRSALPAARPLRVVDLGAGCGAMGLGLLASLGAPFELVAIDRDVAALRIAAAVLDPHITTRVADVTKAALPSAELVIMASLLNELPVAARLPLVERALAALTPDGALIIIEPALRDTARALHELRDAAVAGGAFVFAPCTRQGPCPMLLDPADWCHEDRALKLPPRTAELARLTHLRDGGMKFAYLVLRRQPLPLVDAAGAAWRIVGAPHAAKGKLEMLGCSDAGHVTLRLLRRHRSDANHAFERADRGDVLVIDAAPDGERVEVTAETVVQSAMPRQ